MPSYSGVWNLVAQYQAKAQGLWPQGPGAPTSVTALGGDTQATISFTAPTFTGVPPGIIQYRAISSPGGITTTGASSPLTVAGLTNGTPYTFSVDATNGIGFGPSGVSNSVTPVLPRGLFAGGVPPSGPDLNTINYITISTTGNAIYFGDLTARCNSQASCSFGTWGVFAGGIINSSISSGMQYVNIESTGNSFNFGNLTNSVYALAGLANSTRGVFAGGAGGTVTNVIQYITQFGGNAIDFGDLSQGVVGLAACASPTTGLFAGGENQGGSRTSSIQQITINSTGNSTNFGNLTASRTDFAGCSSSTRGIFAGGFGYISQIQFVTIASGGDATNFGNLLTGNQNLAACSSQTRGVFGGGNEVGTRTNTIQYVTIASTGNAIDFGDLVSPRQSTASCSNAHGGL